MKTEKEIREIIALLENVTEVTKSCKEVSQHYESMAAILEWVITPPTPVRSE